MVDAMYNAQLVFAGLAVCSRRSDLNLSLLQLNSSYYIVLRFTP